MMKMKKMALGLVNNEVNKILLEEENEFEMERLNAKHDDLNAGGVDIAIFPRGVSLIV